MEILSKITPAETLLIQKGGSASLKELLKFTMMDLLLKKVLDIETLEDELDEEGNPLKIIKKGSEFDNYQALPHELPFAEPFQKSSDLEVLFKDLIKIVYEKVRSKTSYVFKYLMESDVIYGCFKSGFFNRTFGTISITADGKIVRKEINIALEDLEHHLPEMIKEKPDEAAIAIRKIGGNIFLIDDFDFELLKQFDEEVYKDLRRYNDFDDDFIIYFVLFDSVFDDFGNAGDWDFGGDGGGDGGCGGGCGGCGGCGG